MQLALKKHHPWATSRLTLPTKILIRNWQE